MKKEEFEKSAGSVLLTLKALFEEMSEFLATQGIFMSIGGHVVFISEGNIRACSFFGGDSRLMIKIPEVLAHDFSQMIEALDKQEATTFSVNEKKGKKSWLN